MVETTGYGALRDLQNVGDLRVAKALKLLQNQDFAVLVGEFVEGAPK